MSRYISFRCPDDLADEIEREGSNRSQAICDLLREALAARLSRSPVQGVPDAAPQAPTRQSSLRRPPVEVNGKRIPRNQQLATLAGPRCPKHRDFLWSECRRLECRGEYAASLARKG